VKTKAFACTVGFFMASLLLSLFAFLPANLDAQQTKNIILLIRVPEVLCAILTGIALAVSGLVFQIVLRNPLADSYVVGISGGGAFGVTLTLLVFGMGGAAFPLRALSSFVVGGGSLFLLLRISKGSPERLLLAGVLVNTAFAALARLLVSFLDPSEIATTNTLLLGFIYPLSFGELAFAFVLILLALRALMKIGCAIDILSFSDDEAKTLGVNVGSTRTAALAASAMLAATAVSLSGMIGFIGLIVPHLARPVFGNNFKSLMTASLFFGPTLLLLAYLMTKIVSSIVIVPVGLYINFVGILFFFALLTKKELFNGS
jgi:ABC-type Fe3+-siderophore transport system permease subunit